MDYLVALWVEKDIEIGLSVLRNPLVNTTISTTPLPHIAQPRVRDIGASRPGQPGRVTFPLNPQ